jgi:DNA-directed RNA polymerase specialized sigma24 family protein
VREPGHLVAAWARSAELARLVELRCFVGLSIDETARVLGTSPASVDRGWRLARAWLKSALPEPG